MPVSLAGNEGFDRRAWAWMTHFGFTNQPPPAGNNGKLLVCTVVFGFGLFLSRGTGMVGERKARVVA